jgi:hypothetical protein
LATQQSKKTLRWSLWNELGKKQMDYLRREHDLIRPVGKALWQLRLAPYPLDAETAAAINWIMEAYVASWPIFELSVEEWAYAPFFENAVRFEMEINMRGRAKAESMIPDSETLREFLDGVIPESLVGEWGQDFAEECDNFMSAVREGFIHDEPSLLGHFIRLPHLKTAQHLSLVPHAVP